jgi:three-Cys-motif partner protein
MTGAILPPHLNPKKYEIDEDSLPREIVGEWVWEKHARLQKYVGISSGVRQKFLGLRGAGATYIDLFCGPGRSKIVRTTKVIDGSPLVAWKESVARKTAFSQVHIADFDSTFVDAAKARLKSAGAPVFAEVGSASATVDKVISKLNRHGLHLAFLDPFNLEALPFEVIRKLAAIKHMDILVHISGQDLQRNLRTYVEKKASPLDTFAPRWRDNVDTRRRGFDVRSAILDHWKKLVRAEGMRTAETFEKVRGPNKQPLYWLAFAARHDRAHEFWNKIRDVSGEAELPF